MADHASKSQNHEKIIHESEWIRVCVCWECLVVTPVLSSTARAHDAILVLPEHRDEAEAVRVSHLHVVQHGAAVAAHAIDWAAVYHVALFIAHEEAKHGAKERWWMCYAFTTSLTWLRAHVVGTDEGVRKPNYLRNRRRSPWGNRNTMNPIWRWLFERLYLPLISDWNTRKPTVEFATTNSLTNLSWSYSCFVSRDGFQNPALTIATRFHCHQQSWEDFSRN